MIPGFVTGLGIFARHEANGVAAPAIFGTITPDKVGRAVVGAIRRDVPEIIVTTRPIRPFLAFAALAPRAAERFTNWLGITAVAHQVASLNSRVASQPERQ